MQKLLTRVRRIFNRRYALGYACAVVGALTSVAAFAAIPDASGTIHGCRKATGALSVIDSATQSCANNETPLNWNQTGPQGPAGPVGPQGPAGADGGVTVASNYVVSGISDPQTILTVPGLVSITSTCNPNSSGSNVIPLMQVKNISTELAQTVFGQVGSLTDLPPNGASEYTQDETNPLTIRFQSGKSVVITTGSRLAQDSVSGATTGCKFLAHATIAN